MNAKRKEAAIKLLHSQMGDEANMDDLTEILQNSDKNYAPEEVTEILQAFSDSAEDLPEEKPDKPTYDKLFCRDRNITAIKGEDAEKPLNTWWELSVIENKRQGIKISERNANELNQQAHNTLLFYAISGEVKVGDKVIIKIPRGGTMVVDEVIKNQY